MEECTRGQLRSGSAADKDKYSERVAQTEERCELFENAPRGVFGSRDDLLSGKRGEVIEESGTYHHVIQQAKLHAAARAEDHLPDVIGCEQCDLGNGLWKRGRTRDDITLGARAAFEVRTQAMCSIFKVEQEFRRQSLRLALNVSLNTRPLKKGMAVMIKVIELDRNVLRNLRPRNTPAAKRLRMPACAVPEAE